MKFSISKIFMAGFIILAAQASWAQTATSVAPFTKVIISPNIQVTFVEGNNESVTVEKSTVNSDKIHIEVNDNTLRIYLDGQKDFPKNKTTYEDGRKEKESLYKGTVVTATVVYKMLNSLSIRGEETQLLKSPVEADKFKLTVYGESHVIFEKVDFNQLQAVLYGESEIDIKSGTIRDQRYTAYGESKINALGIDNKTTKITAYGESTFRIHSDEAIRLTAFGDANVAYKGKASVEKGLTIGDTHISRID